MNGLMDVKGRCDEAECCFKGTPYTACQSKTIKGCLHSTPRKRESILKRWRTAAICWKLGTIKLAYVGY